MMSGLSPIAKRLAGRMHWSGPSETQILVASGLGVGLGAGLGAVVFRALINEFTHLFFGVLEPALRQTLGSAAVVLIPVVGALLFGPLIYFFAREAKGHGVPEVMEAVALRGGRIRPVVAVGKSLASALCIGSGGSVGREGPIVQIGSALGSTIGQLFHMSDQRIRTLVACGAAGGIAATFNAPIAGVFFALELILGEFSTRSFGVVVIASVTASVVGRTAFGNAPAFAVPPYQLAHVSEFIFYAILGVIGGVVGVAFSRTLYWFEDRFDAIPMLEYLKPAIGGLLLGGIGFFLPQIFGVGYPAMGDALAGKFGVRLLIVLVVAKMLAVSLTIGSGGSGGVFAPSLFMGAMLGTAYGLVLGRLFPGVVSPAGAYGLVGMGAVFAGAARAPITAVIILFELTGDYRIILPLMVTVALSTFLSEAISRDTIYTLKLRRRGIDLHLGRDVDPMRSIPVAAAMTDTVPHVPADLAVTEAAEYLDQSHSPALVVFDERDALLGIVTASDLERAILDNKIGATVKELASRPVVTALPDEDLSEAIHRMNTHDVRQMPVVAGDNPTQVIGMLNRSDVIRAYSRTVLKQLETQRRRPVPAEELRGTQLVEVTVDERSPLAGQFLRDLRLPSDTLVITIERDGQTIIPRGITRLLPGDRAMILVQSTQLNELHAHIAAMAPKKNAIDGDAPQGPPRNVGPD
ncbi:MAG: chloride channel protein [Chloroflexota bacterium]|nr:chloride channel protein [Chloroflexota bacterium]